MYACIKIIKELHFIIDNIMQGQWKIIIRWFVWVAIIYKI